jgi:hypothetical protein
MKLTVIVEHISFYREHILMTLANDYIQNTFHSIENTFHSQNDREHLSSYREHISSYREQILRTLTADSSTSSLQRRPF